MWAVHSCNSWFVKKIVLRSEIKEICSVFMKLVYIHVIPLHSILEMFSLSAPVLFLNVFLIVHNIADVCFKHCFYMFKEPR